MPLPALTRTTLGKPLSILINSLDLSHRLSILDAFQSLQDLNNYLALVHLNPGASLLYEPYKMDLLVEPVSRRFLSIKPSVEMQESSSALVTCLRAGALLYLAELRRRSGISPVMTTFQVDRLMQSLKIIAKPFDLDHSIHLWVLTVGAIESPTLDSRSYFCSKIKQLRSYIGIETMTQYEHHLHRVVWFDPLFQARLSVLFPLT
jgi:hypothetical protein